MKSLPKSEDPGTLPTSPIMTPSVIISWRSSGAPEGGLPVVAGLSCSDKTSTRRSGNIVTRSEGRSRKWESASYDLSSDSRSRCN